MGKTILETLENISNKDVSLEFRIGLPDAVSAPLFSGLGMLCRWQKLPGPDSSKSDNYNRHSIKTSYQ